MNPAISKLLTATAEQRQEILSRLSPEELAQVFKELENIENSPARRWYCTREMCDGRPHAGFHWCDHPIDSENHTPYCNHSRTPQRPPAEDPMNPWLVWFFSGGRGTGKALALDTLIPTPSGWAKMGEIKVGDIVFDEQGRMCNVTNTFDVMPERAYRLTFSDGSEIVACGEHQWVTLDNPSYEDDWASGKRPITTSEIVRKERKHFIPPAKSADIPSFMLPTNEPSVREVVSATEELLQPMRCLTVDSPNSMYLAGEGMIPTHNTRAGAEWVLDLVWNQGYKRIALVGRTPADVRDVMIYGDSGIMSVSDPHPRPAHEPTKRRLVWPNGAQAFTYSAAAPSQLRGPQHDAAWCVAEGELVATHRGEIPIEQVQVGDSVWTRNGLRRVLATTLTNPCAEIMEIHDNEGRVLRCTPNHRVFVNGEWCLAENVTPSDTLVVSVATNTCVSAVFRNGQTAAVYDLTVEGEHEFFASGILVHNCDELAAWTDAPKGDVLDTSWNNLMLGLRLPGHNPKCLVTTTPKRVKLVRQVMERKSTVITNGTTYENLHNMAAAFREQVLQAYEGTRIGRQELDGVLLTDVDGALWNLEMIDENRGRFAYSTRGESND